MKKQLLNTTLASLLLLSLYGCGAKDNTEPPKPLTKYTFTVHPKIDWKQSVTSGSGTGTRLGLAQDKYRLIAVGKEGDVTALDKRSGKQIWQVELNSAISAAAADNGSSVFIPMRNGGVIALNALNGKTEWTAKLQSTILAAPAAKGNTIIVHEHNGDVVGLNAQTGKISWTYNGTTPNLMLQGSSSPLIGDGLAYVGFSSGQLFAFEPSTGKVKWNRPIAIPEGSTVVKRMIDIDATPVLGEFGLYAVSYHGNLVALNPENGQLIWQHALSSYNNIAVGEKGVFVTNEKSHVFGVDAGTGRTLWQQDALEARWVTGPVLYQNSVVVGDFAGVVHFINKQNGKLQGRISVGESAIEGPGLISNNMLYFVTRDGRVSAVQA